VGSVTAVQLDSSGPDPTVPAAPPEVPALEVAAVKPLWLARLQPTPRPPQPAATSRQCSVTSSISQSCEHWHPPRGYEYPPRDPRFSEDGHLSLTLTGISWHVAGHSPTASG
jgi:hypothetical protein